MSSYLFLHSFQGALNPGRNFVSCVSCVHLDRPCQSIYLDCLQGIDVSSVLGYDSCFFYTVFVLGIVTKVHLLYIMYQEVFYYYTDKFWMEPTFCL